MQVGGITGGIYKVCDWLMKLAIINLLWLLFTLVGLGLFGIFPATVAMLSVLNRWINQEECKVVPYFATVFKRSFVKANILMGFAVMVGAVLIANFYIIQAMDGLLHVFLKYGVIVLFVFYSMIVLYVLPVFSHHSQGVWNTFKMSFITSALHPLRTGVLVAGFGLLYLIIRSFPGMIPFYGVSLIGMWTAVILSPIFEREQKKKHEGLPILQ
ncbi:YesL family protein [Halalkalibacter kiskunsagensis]|uniref:YesL family protein n=1 Tax=Halalkalibacter kiskunsagensis TaxID=1548599 RepID=A0ABV6KH25_9BACI